MDMVLGVYIERESEGLGKARKEERGGLWFGYLIMPIPAHEKF